MYHIKVNVYSTEHRKNILGNTALNLSIVLSVINPKTLTSMH